MRRKRGELSADDLEVWRKVEKTAKPIHRNPSPANATTTKKTIKSSVSAISLTPKPRVEAPIRLDLSRDPMHEIREQPVRMDAKTHRRMQRGKLKPDAKIDLHGLTLSDAHSRLTGFLLAAHGRGDRLVLVITGKGRAPELHHGAVQQHKGVLRQSVPRWLSLAPLAQVVLQVSPASQRHGGQGAYYIYLKRLRDA